VEINGRALNRESIAGRDHWSARGSRDGAPVTRGAHLLPNYDELFVGFRDRLAFAERLRMQNPKARVDALLGHMLFIDGQIVGGWRRTLGRTIDVEVRVPSALSATEQKLVEREIRRFGDFLGAPARVRYRRGAVALTAASSRDSTM